MSIGVKGMLVAAKTMALTGYDLFVAGEHSEKARSEFEQRRGTTKYAPRVPEMPPIPK